MTRWIAVLALAGCHVTTATDDTRYGASQRVRHPEGAIARKPAIVLDDAGALRFVEPLECPTEDVVEAHTATEIATRPNLATFVVGVVATALGGVLATRGAFSDDPLGSPSTYAGAAALAAGLALAIGPWLGNHNELRAGAPVAPIHRPGPSEPCGDRPLAARAATLTIHDREVHGAIDGAGVFAVSAFQLVDAYEPKSASLDFTAVVDATGGARTIAGVLDGGALAARAGAFLAHADFDAKIEPLRAVPNLTAKTPLVALTDDPAIRVSLAVRNEGPGDAFALRGAITASHPAIDGRILYIGKLARGASVVRELAIPISRAAADALRGAQLELSIELRDAHRTAPTTPLRFRGVVR